MNRIYMKAFSLFMLLGAAGLFVMVGLVQAGEEAYDEDTYGPAAPIVWTKPVKAVVFNHKRHTMDAGLTCDNCHDTLFQMAAGTAESGDDFTMKSLYAGKYCGACHDGSTAFASNTRCATCHIGVKGHKRLTGATPEGEGHGEARH